MASSSNNIAVEVLEAMVGILQQRVAQSSAVNTNKESTPSRTVLPSPSSEAEADSKDISTPVTAVALPESKDHQISRCKKRKAKQAESGKTIEERPMKKSYASSAPSTERKESKLMISLGKPLYPPNQGNIFDLAHKPKKFTPEKPNPRHCNPQKIKPKPRYSVEKDTVDWHVHSHNRITDNQKDLLTMCFRHIRAGSMDPNIVKKIEREFSQLKKASSRVASKEMVSNDIMQKLATEESWNAQFAWADLC